LTLVGRRKRNVHMPVDAIVAENLIDGGDREPRESSTPFRGGSGDKESRKAGVVRAIMTRFSPPQEDAVRLAAWLRSINGRRRDSHVYKIDRAAGPDLEAASRRGAGAQLD